MPDKPDKKNQKKDKSREVAQWEKEQENLRQDLLVQAWVARNNLYQELFGQPAYVSPAGYAAPSFKNQSKAKGASKGSSSVSDDDQLLAVLAYGPDPFRPYWTYVTAGLASPWTQSEPLEVSGFGCELMIKSPHDHPWAAQILRTMAFYIFNHAGTLTPGRRLAFNAPIVANSQSQLRNAIIWYADEAPDAWYQLPSGGFGLFLALGVTDDECQFAEKAENYGSWCIEQLLRRKGHGQVTNPDRGCMMKEEDTAGILRGIQEFADTFRQFDVERAPEEDS
jgi:Suppressor of fused protein (SUFU)